VQYGEQVDGWVQKKLQCELGKKIQWRREAISMYERGLTSRWPNGSNGQVETSEV
jgi:hypothetical protein